LASTGEKIMIVLDVHEAAIILAFIVMFPALIDVFNAYKEWFMRWLESKKKS
jgi:hypothetical protein